MNYQNTAKIAIKIIPVRFATVSGIKALFCNAQNKYLPGILEQQQMTKLDKIQLF